MSFERRGKSLRGGDGLGGVKPSAALPGNAPTAVPPWFGDRKRRLDSKTFCELSVKNVVDYWFTWTTVAGGKPLK